MATTTTTTTNATLASRAAGLLTKQTAFAIAEKAMDQAIAARRVYPAMAEDFGAQLGHDLPLKTKDFTRVVGHLLQASEKPLKGIISKRKGEILSVLAEIVGALTDTPAISLPAWAIPKERAKKAEAEAVDVSGALDRANGEAEANESAEYLAEAAAEAAEAAAEAARAAKGTTALANAVALIITNAAALSAEQREALTLALASTEAATM